MRNKNWWIVGVLIAGLHTASATAADEWDARAVARLHAQTEVLRAQLENEEVRLSLEALRQEKINAEAPKEALPPPPPPYVPVVAAVEGIGEIRAAILVMENGGRMEVIVGDRLPNGSVVTEIMPNRVVVSDKGREVVLAFASGQLGAPAR